MEWEHSSPHPTQKSALRLQYSYWADRNFALSRLLSALVCWFTRTRSLRNFQCLRITWVPNLTFRVLPDVPGSLWVTTRTLPLPFHLHALFTVNDLVVEHARKLELITLRRVGVQNHRAVEQQLLGDEFPLSLPDGTWSGGTLHCDLWLQFA